MNEQHESISFLFNFLFMFLAIYISCSCHYIYYIYFHYNGKAMLLASITQWFFFFSSFCALIIFVPKHFSKQSYAQWVFWMTSWLISPKKALCSPVLFIWLKGLSTWHQPDVHSPLISNSGRSIQCLKKIIISFYWP